MILEIVCDNDGFVSSDTVAITNHFTSNPTHISSYRAVGDLATPAGYGTGGSSTIPQVTTDPVSPTAGQIWVLATGTVGTGGQAMGVLGLTYSRSEVRRYDLSYKASNGSIIRMRLS